MALPQPGTAWPPIEWAPAFDQYRMNDALYSGDVTELANIFAGSGPAGGTRGDSDAAHYNTVRTATRKRQGMIAGLIDSVRSWFWGTRSPANAQRTRLHSPLAGNLATLSADILMSEPPAFRFVDGDGETMKGDGQDRLDDLMNGPAIRAALVEAAEYCAGLSAVALTVQWNPDKVDRPWIGVVGCDAVVPEWDGGVLSAVTLWTVYPDLDDVGLSRANYYHLERHESGLIVHALYKGTDASIGVQVPITDLPALEYLTTIPGGRVGENGLTIELPTGTEYLTATWWRNLPTRRFRRHGILNRAGRADWEGVEHYLDQIDMTWSAWMRDIKLARARLIVGDDLLDDAGGHPSFDDDAEILKGLNFAPLNPEDPPIVAQQFEIRAEDHARTILGLTKEVLQHAGYSLASYGEYGDVQKTATEVSDRKTATERTRDKKALYFVQAVSPLVHALLDIDRIHHGAPGIPADGTLTITFPEQSQIDPEVQGRVFVSLRSAMVASTKTLVAMLHPDWDKDMIDDEVDLIMQENPLGQEVDAAIEGREGDGPPEVDEDGNPIEPEPADADADQTEAVPA